MKKLLSLILSVTTVFSVCFTVTAVDPVQTAAVITPVAEESYYSRNALKTLENGENLVKTYDAIYEAVSCLIKTVDVSGYNLTESQVDTVFNAYVNDCPEHFWMSDDNGRYYSITKVGNAIKRLEFFYDFSSLDELDTAQQAFSEAVNDAISGITSAKEEDIALYLHDYLTEHIEYGEEADSHNAYGALVNGKAVCDGYAKAYQIVLNTMGIECFCVTGVSDNERHAWNMVKINGEWVQTDVTSDDPDDCAAEEQGDLKADIFHCYYACSDNDIANYSRDQTDYSLPACTTSAYRLFSVGKGNLIDEATVANIVSLLLAGKEGDIAKCDFICTADENPIPFIQSRVSDIAYLCGMYGKIGAAFYNVGDECQVILKLKSKFAINNFPDVNKSDWYARAVEFCSVKGLFAGKANGSFDPVSGIDRQDFVVVLARLAGAKQADYINASINLSDVSKDGYYYWSVAWAKLNNVVSGYENGSFGVGHKITREQIMVILYRYFGNHLKRDVSVSKSTDEILSKYRDEKLISPWARDAVAWAVENKVISGKDNGTRVDPIGYASRAEIAAIMFNMYNNGLLYTESN